MLSASTIVAEEQRPYNIAQRWIYDDSQLQINKRHHVQSTDKGVDHEAGDFASLGM